MALEEFVSYLSGQGMVDVARLKDESDEGFENRLKVQKYTYLATHFGLDLGYVYNIHLRGPYSRGLTSDYYNLDVASMASASAPSALHHEKFFSVLGGKSVDWLEIAATILYETNRDEGLKLEHFYMLKCDHNPRFIDSVYSELTSLRLL